MLRHVLAVRVLQHPGTDLVVAGLVLAGRERGRMQVVLAGLLLVDRVLVVPERQRRLAVRGLRMGQLPARRLAELAALVQLEFHSQLARLEFHSQLVQLGFQSRLEQLVGRILALLVLPVVQNRLVRLVSQSQLA